jgi:hypothetical protein
MNRRERERRSRLERERLWKVDEERNRRVEEQKRRDAERAADGSRRLLRRPNNKRKQRAKAAKAKAITREALARAVADDNTLRRSQKISASKSRERFSM